MGGRPQPPFVPRPWSDIASDFEAVAASRPQFGHMTAVVHSVIDRGAVELLAGTTSMHDLLVVPTPIPEPPYDVIRVCSPSSHQPPTEGWVLIEHLAVMGRHERVHRPAADAVRLFWRFVRERYGVVPR